MSYIGNPPAEAYTNTVKDTFSGDGSTTAFTMSQISLTNDVRVVVENVVQDPTVAYSCAGTTITFTSAPPTGTNNIYVVHLGPAVMTALPPAEIAQATTFNSNVSVGGNLIVDTNTLYVDSTNNRVGVGTASPSVVLDARLGTTTGKVAELHNSVGYGIGFTVESDGGVNTINAENNQALAFATNGASNERMRIDSSGNVGIGTSSPIEKITANGALVSTASNSTGSTSGANRAILDFTSGGARIGHFRGTTAAGSGYASFYTDSTERVRIDSSGNLLVGKTSSDSGTVGFEAAQDGHAYVTVNNTLPFYINRQSGNELQRFASNGTTVGSISVDSGNLYIASPSGTNPFGVMLIKGTQPRFVPTDTSGGVKDSEVDLGYSNARWEDVYASNGTIQTSDQNEKQQIASLTDAEITAAKAISKLFKTFKWNDSVAEKGDAARTHSGVIAQEVEQAMTDAGLDAGDYAFFISTTWWETQIEVPAVEAVDAVYETVTIPAVVDDDGNEVEPETTEQRLVSEAVEAQEAYTRTNTYDTAEEAPEGATERNRKGIRYPQLLSFIGAATEQRLASIESRLDALENPA